MQDTSFEQQFENILIKENMDLVKHKIMIMSNKGGVGKSTIAANIADELSNQGFQVGLLDIDIHGPSQAKIFNLNNQKLKMNEKNKIIPFQPKENLKIVTIAGMLDDENQSVIWRGPLKINMIKQFIMNVLWNDLDYLIIDAPPGTGDEPLTISQIINLDGMIIVTTPQDLALVDSKKAITFARKLNIKILGVIENMSFFYCSNCNQKIDLFKYNNKQSSFKKMGINILGSLPFDPKLLECMDEGSLFMKNYNQTIVGKMIKNIVSEII